MNWVDVTSYRQSDTRRIPATLELQASGLRIVVTRYRDFPPDAWVMHCHEVGISTLGLKHKDLAEAQLEAMDLVKRRLSRWLAALDQANGEGR
jgi:ribulose-5-phosphate 4-epimerase/fuculose-1-phosphate aldolase